MSRIKERKYFVSYAHKYGFGSVRVTATEGSKLVIEELPKEIIETAKREKTIIPQNVIILNFKEMDPRKEVWSLDE